ncbi:hypothetical protein B9T31_01665 [Acinetobacter sp. ANC 4558]|uniref:MFS transporter n=1 Tax=Acinetobacter sp. ANC 4558 TaxID=1977876 RepID=UPI000A34D028|nr:MFS transporter [Acinetobacter sp. ANC 4558]OTG88255.1 hypothetical protein B9T31_01665 [Acinetobacter sp. ANC 4558]
MQLSKANLPKIMSSENVLMFSGIIAAFHLGKVSPAVPILQETLNLTVIEAGFLISLMQFAGALFGLIMGGFSEKIGAARSILIGQFILIISSISTIFVYHPLQLLMLRAMESFGFLMVVLPTPGLIRKLVPANKLSFRLGLWSCYMAIGTSSAFILGPYLIEMIGWHGWWYVPAVMSVFCMILLQRGLSHVLKRSNQKVYTFEDLWNTQFKSVLKHKNTWFVGLAFAMYTGPWITIIGFLPTIYHQVGISNIYAGFLTACASLVNIVGNILAAVLIHRGIQAKKLLMLGYLTLFVTVFVAFSPFYTLISIQYIAILLFSAVGGLIPAILFILGVKSAPNNETVAAAVGLVQQCSSLGMLFIPPFIARVAEGVGSWNLTWVVIGIAALIGLLLSTNVARQYQ